MGGVIRVAVTGAAGQIGYSLVPRIAAGEMFGAMKVPNGLSNRRPPERTSLASPRAPSAAWQEAQPLR